MYQVKEPSELMTFLQTQLPSKGRNKIKSILTRGQVRVDGKVVTMYNHPLTPGQRVSIAWDFVEAPAKQVGIQIVYEDEAIIVIDKGAGMLTIATETERERTAYHILTDHVRKQHSRNRIFVVHRLDRDTSGIMLFAKRADVKETLQAQWKERILERRYAVLVEGEVTQPEGTITSWLKETKTLKMYSSPHPNDGQKAVTHFQVVETNGLWTLLDVQLETGRKNQIRVHMQDIGHPVVGDVKYGATKKPIGRMGLHAHVLSLLHPLTDEQLRFEADIPKAFRAALRAPTTDN